MRGHAVWGWLCALTDFEDADEAGSGDVLAYLVDPRATNVLTPTATKWPRVNAQR